MTTLQSLLLVGPVLLISVIAHEYAHGYAAMLQGDMTAKEMGRLTWNPIRHIDLFMTILLPAFLWKISNGAVVLGGAKPVPVNPANFRNYRRGDIIVSLAGVTVNLLLALACVPAIVLLGLVARVLVPVRGAIGVVQVMLIMGIWINLLLLAFNLIPIPPLDGSQVVKHLLPRSWMPYYWKYARFGIVLLVALLYFGGRLFNLWLQPAMSLTDWLVRLVGPFMVSGVPLGVAG